MKSVDSRLTEHLSKINEIADAEIAKFIRGLPKHIDDMLRNAVLSLLGLTRRSGAYEVDHCNGHRSFITSVCERRAKVLIEEKMGAIVKEGMEKLIASEAAKKAVIDEAKAKYTLEFRKAILDAVEQKAREDARNFASSLLSGSSDIRVLPKNTELEDPESFGGELGNVMLEEKAIEMAAEEESPDDEDIKDFIQELEALDR